MKLSKILEEKIALRIADSPNEVFMRQDFNDLADYNQVGRRRAPSRAAASR